ncbi:MAG TPA: hypothetical protein VIJ28_16305 [Chloroflexota bacterium]
MEAHAYPSGAVAPWAEVVRGAGPCTVEELLRLPDDGWQYEVVEGVLVRMAGSPAEPTMLAARLGTRIGLFVEDHDLGVVTGPDGVYDFERRGQKNTGLWLRQGKERRREAAVLALRLNAKAARPRRQRPSLSRATAGTAD